MILFEELLLMAIDAARRVHLFFKWLLRHEVVLFCSMDGASTVFKQVSVDSIFVLKVLFFSWGL